MKELFENKTPEQNISLAGKDLTGKDFSNSRLDGVCFEGALINKTNFKGCRRNNAQVVKMAQVSIGDKYIYGFLCKERTGVKVFIKEQGKPEYKFNASKANIYARTIYNLLIHG